MQHNDHRRLHPRTCRSPKQKLCLDLGTQSVQQTGPAHYCALPERVRPALLSSPGRSGTPYRTVSFDHSQVIPPHPESAPDLNRGHLPDADALPDRHVGDPDDLRPLCRSRPSPWTSSAVVESLIEAVVVSRAGWRVDNDGVSDPEWLAETIVKQTDSEMLSQPAESGGAERAAAMLRELLRTTRRLMLGQVGQNRM